jgi:8-oxo-dGTP pyrophosphatase MutT (NUDIX family)
MPDRTLRELSAGGVVVRDGQVAVVIPRKLSPEGRPVLALPKGHPDGDETLEQAATREVREETGLDAEPVEKLGDIGYFYRRKGALVRKTVAFFLFRYLGGDLADHDHEITEARWLPLEEARTALTFEGERAMVDRALSRTRPDR